MQASHCGGFSCWGTRALCTQASVVSVCGLSSCSSLALERCFSSRGSLSQFSRSMWDLPRGRIKPVSPALAGRFLTTGPPGKPLFSTLKILFYHVIILSSLLFIFLRSLLFCSYSAIVTVWVIYLSYLLRFFSVFLMLCSFTTTCQIWISYYLSCQVLEAAPLA